MHSFRQRFSELFRSSEPTIPGVGSLRRSRDTLKYQVKDYKSKLKSRPEDFEGWLQFGHILKATGEREEAHSAYKRALDINPLDPNVHIQLGHSYKLLGDIPLSIHHYRRAFELGSRDVEALAGGYGTLISGTYNPDHIFSIEAVSNFTDGDRFRDLRAWEQAAMYYISGLAREPAAFPYWVQLGHVLKENGDAPGALQAYLEALTLNPLDTDLHVQLGHYHGIAGDIPISIRHYRRAVELGSKDLQAFRGACTSFRSASLTRLIEASNDGNRSFVVRTSGDFLALSCLILGRRPDEEELEKPFEGTPLIGLADTLVASREFSDVMLEQFLCSGTLPHEQNLGWSEWWLVLEFLPASGICPSRISTMSEICGATLTKLEGVQFISAAYCELLLRKPDASGLLSHARNLTMGAEKKALIADFLNSIEFEYTGQNICINWEDHIDPYDAFCAANRNYLDILSTLIHPYTLSDNVKEPLLRELDGRTVSRREIGERILSQFEADHGILYDAMPDKPDWRGLFQALFAEGPMGKILTRRYGSAANQLLDTLKLPIQDLAVLRNGTLIVDEPALMALPNSPDGEQLDERGLDLYGELVRSLSKLKVAA